MGKAVLTFDQMEIINKKSDTQHSDNDWLIITWFVQDKLIRTDKIPLQNTANSVVLDSGNIIAPVASEVDCNDGDLVTASFVVVNLGSTDFSDQIDAAGDIAKKISQAVADVYVHAAEIVVANSGIPLGEVFAQGLEEVRPVIVDSVGAAFDDVIVPAIQALVDEINVLLGHPNCNGDVFHDIAVFPPGGPYPDSTTWRIYTAGSETGCGSPAKTSVHFNQQRVLSVPQQFSTAPPPQVSTAPAHGESADGWLGTWAEDPNTPTPLIVVTIARSLRASGLYSISIHEKIDPRFNVIFETGADPISLQTRNLFPFTENVFGQLKPWLQSAVKPGNLQAVTATVKSLGLGGASGTQSVLRAAAGVTVELRRTASTVRNIPAVRNSPPIRLAWTRPQTQGISPIHFSLPGAVSSVVGADPHLNLVTDTVDVFPLTEQGVIVALYAFRTGETVIGHGVRYIRNETSSYTRADVMLVKWNPVK